MGTIRFLQPAMHRLTNGSRVVEVTKFQPGETLEIPRRANAFRDQISSEAEETDRTLSEYGYRPDGMLATRDEVVAASERLAKGDYGKVYERV